MAMLVSASVSVKKEENDRNDRSGRQAWQATSAAGAPAREKLKLLRGA